jgi:hypothetical protein
MVLAIGASPLTAQQTPPSQPPAQRPAQPPAQAPAQETPAAIPQSQAQQQITSPLQADLVSVDPEAKTVTVKTTAGQEIQFKYSDKTEVSGAQKNVAGLATLKEGRVTVHFTEDAKKVRTATRIVVEERKQ